MTIGKGKRLSAQRNEVGYFLYHQIFAAPALFPSRSVSACAVCSPKYGSMREMAMLRQQSV